MKKRQRYVGMRKKGLGYSLILIELLIQIFGGIYYDQTPAIVWSLANAILILIPLMFGIKLGLLCFIPVLASEILWFCKLSTTGPILHAISFALTILILGMANKKLKYAQYPRRVILSSILYEISLLGEETLYYSLIFLFRHRPIRWEAVSGTFISLANPLLLILLVIFCKDDNDPKDKNSTSSRFA